jgi:hypothetical protein
MEGVNPGPPYKYADKNETEYHKRQSHTFPVPFGYVIDTSRGDTGIAGDPLPSGSTSGVHIDSKNAYGPSEFTLDIQPDHVTVNVDVIGMYTTRGYKKIPAYLELFATIYLKKALASVTTYDDTLFITGRAVCSCALEAPIEVRRLPYEKELSVVYEKQLAPVGRRPGGIVEAMSIHDANRFGAHIHREIIQSLSSADRYPRGMVSLLDTQLIAGTISAHIRDGDRSINGRLADSRGIEQEMLKRVVAYSPSITRAQLLDIPLARQVELFDLSFAQAVKMRRVLVDLDAPKGPPPVPERRTYPMPLLIGMQFNEARAILVAADLPVGAMTAVDSPLPTGSILTQEPAAGNNVEGGTEVSVTVASGLSVRLPEVIGLGLAEAGCRLRDTGLRSEPTVKGQPVPDAHVVALEPPAGTLVTPNSAVTISLKRRPKG